VTEYRSDFYLFLATIIIGVAFLAVMTTIDRKPYHYINPQHDLYIKQGVRDPWQQP